jgi:hypothetical protein
MKNILFATAFVCISLSAKAQLVQVKDLSSSVGNWEGTLTYLDYSSGKPFTMLANIKIKLTAIIRKTSRNSNKMVNYLY